MDPHDPDRPDMPHYGFYLGKVVNIQDPDLNGRVRFTIPGLISISNWAPPAGATRTSGKGTGSYDVPAKGATIGVLFRQGDVDNPVYLNGPPNDIDTVIKLGALKKEDADKYKVYNTLKYSVIIDDREDSKSFTVINRESMDFIKLDGNTDTLNAETTGDITLKSDTKVIIDAPLVSVTQDNASQAFVRGDDWASTFESYTQQAQTALTVYQTAMTAAFATMAANTAPLVTRAEVAAAAASVTAAGVILTTTLTALDSTMQAQSNIYLSKKASTE